MLLLVEQQQRPLADQIFQRAAVGVSGAQGHRIAGEDSLRLLWVGDYDERWRKAGRVEHENIAVALAPTGKQPRLGQQPAKAERKPRPPWARWTCVHFRHAI